MKSSQCSGKTPAFWAVIWQSEQFQKTFVSPLFSIKSLWLFLLYARADFLCFKHCIDLLSSNIVYTIMHTVECFYHFDRCGFVLSERCVNSHIQRHWRHFRSLLEPSWWQSGSKCIGWLGEAFCNCSICTVNSYSESCLYCMCVYWDNLKSCSQMSIKTTRWEITRFCIRSVAWELISFLAIAPMMMKPS